LNDEIIQKLLIKILVKTTKRMKKKFGRKTPKNDEI